MPKSNGRPANRRRKTVRNPNVVPTTTMNAKPTLFNERCACGGKITRFGECYSCGAPAGMSMMDLAKRSLR